jgi:hypothetical protein
MLAACASVPEDTYSVDSSKVLVVNGYLGEVDLFVVAGATRTRIGTVQSGRTKEFVIPRPLMARTEIQFQVDPVGPAAPFTFPSIALVPGNIIELSLAPTLQMSSIAIVRE